MVFSSKRILVTSVFANGYFINPIFYIFEIMFSLSQSPFSQPSPHLCHPHQTLLVSSKNQQNEGHTSKTFSLQDSIEKQKNVKDDLTSSQIMNNLNSSFDGLFSRIQRIKQQNNPLEELKDDQNSDRFPKFSFKKYKSGNKTLSLKTINNLNEQDEDQSKDSFTLTKNIRLFSSQRGLLDIAAMKISMEIADDEVIESKEQKLTEQSFNKIQLKITDFQLGKCVGSGKFGDVFICRHKLTNGIFALKKIFKSTIQQYNMVNQFILELRIHYMLDHPNIIKIYGHFQDTYHVFLLMEYAEGGILLKKLQSTEEYTSQIIEQTIFAIDYLHQNQITHRDIKPENIVLQFNSVVKLCDFGWSSFFRNKMKTTFCGTLDYLSPEMKDKGQYDNSVDLWSLGVLTFQMLTGKPPHKKQIADWKGKGGKRQDKWDWHIEYPETISSRGQSFICNLLKQKPQERATLKECLYHNFILKHRYFLEESEYFFEFNSII